MKFHCDRCKTRYSIADERVRGKILKIRCKNCEAVITVREGMEVPSGEGAAVDASSKSAPRIPDDARRKRTSQAKRPAALAKAKPAAPALPTLSGPPSGPSPVLQGAFAAAFERSAADEFSGDDRTEIADAPPRAMPQHLEEEWYVSHEGEQFGPFGLERAKEWIRERGPNDELFCWSEGFDDWLAVDKVSHFRSLRAPSSPLRPAPPSARPAAAAAAAPVGGDEPQPLFAATMAAVEAESARHVVPAAAKAVKTNGSSAPADDDESSRLEFDIGEASRVVKMPQLAAALRPTNAGSAGAALPGVGGKGADGAPRLGNGTGGAAALRQSGPIVVPLSEAALQAAQPGVLQPGSKRKTRWPLIAALVVLTGVLGVMIVLALRSDSATGLTVRRSSSNYENLGFQNDPRTVRVEVEKEPTDKGTGGRTGGGVRRPARGGGSVTGNPSSLFGKDDTTTFGGSDDNRPLDGDDLMNAYRENQIAVRWCYENALKKDPLLDVKKIYVDMSVAPSGVVTSVRLSEQGNTELGTCLVSRMRRWKFRKSPETFTGRFPLVFKN